MTWQYASSEVEARTMRDRGSCEPTLRKEEAKDGAPTDYGLIKGGPPAKVVVKA